MACTLSEKRDQIVKMVSLMKSRGTVTVPLITSLGIAKRSTARHRLRTLESAGFIIATEGKPTRWRFVDDLDDERLQGYMEIMTRVNIPEKYRYTMDKQVLDIIKNNEGVSIYYIRQKTRSGYHRIKRIVDEAIANGVIEVFPATKRRGNTFISKGKRTQRKPGYDVAGDKEHMEWMRQWAQNKNKKNKLRNSAMSRI